MVFFDITGSSGDIHTIDAGWWSVRDAIERSIDDLDQETVMALARDPKAFGDAALEKIFQFNAEGVAREDWPDTLLLAAMAVGSYREELWATVS